MMKSAKRTLLSILLILGVSFASTMAAAQSGHDLYQQALVKERAEGDLEAAISFYERIVREHAHERSLAARALLQMGQCYEKLGKKEAEKAYRQLVEEYADQRVPVKAARARLSALARPARDFDPSAMTARRLWSGPGVDVLGSPSRDGRYLSYVAWDTGDLAVRDLVSSENRRLTNKGSWYDSFEYAESSTISPDGNHVAYAWFNGSSYELRAIGFEGSGERTLYSNAEVFWIMVADWSPDGKEVLALFSRRDGNNQMVLVSVADGSVRVLKTLGWRYPEAVRFSPDGKHIAYDFPSKEEVTERDIFLMAVDGSREIQLTDHPANDLYPLWTPDGKRVVFISDRTGTVSAWSIPVEDGRAQGKPELVKSELGRTRPLGFSKSGSFYYGLHTGISDVHVVSRDPETGEVSGSSTKIVTRYEGVNSAPSWSPDGRHLAYFSQRGSSPLGRGARVIVIRSVETGAEREVQPQLNRVNPSYGLRWFPDGTGLILSGYDTEGRQGIYRIHWETGEATSLVQRSDRALYVQRGEASPDGRALFYVGTGDMTRIVARDLQTNSENDLVTTSSSVASLAVSPDGRRVAFIEEVKKARSVCLKVVSVSGGEPTTVLCVQDPYHIGILAWAPDGKTLVFGQSGESDPGSGIAIVDLHQVSVESGAMSEVGVTVEGFWNQVSMHPDGRRITYASGFLNEAEIWAMENILPTTRAPR